MITADNIVIGFKELGVCAGDTILVHSSLSSFGKVRGGAKTVVDSLLAVIGSEGTLVVPTFNFTPEYFDVNETPSVVGAITEEVRKRLDAIRSLHPTHSVAAIGRFAKEITDGHEQTTSFGHGSALHKLLELNGKVMLIGVDHTTSSIIHVAEELVEVSYLERVRRVVVALPNGRKITRVIRRPGCSKGFNRIAGRLEATGDVSRITIGHSVIQLMPSAAVVVTAISMLRDDQTALLCDNPDCQSCAEARAMVSALEEQAAEQALAAFLKEPVGENIYPFECSMEGIENGENRN